MQCTVYSVHFPYSNCSVQLQCAVCHAAVSSVLGAVYSLQCTFSVLCLQCTVSSVLFEVCNVQCTVCSVLFAVYSVQCIVYSVKCAVYNVQYIMYSIPC